MCAISLQAATYPPCLHVTQIQGLDADARRFVSAGFKELEYQDGGSGEGGCT